MRAGRGAENLSVLHFADDLVEPLVALQRDVLRILIADGAELPVHFLKRNA